jgi:uncharacterized membrane-anchored protein
MIIILIFALISFIFAAALGLTKRDYVAVALSIGLALTLFVIHPWPWT